MPKYLVQGSYTIEGLKALQRDKASGRRAAVAGLVESVGGKLEAFYYAFGEDDFVIVGELPDNVTAAAMSLAPASAGIVRIRTTPLLTVEEVDAALEKSPSFRAQEQ